MKMNDSLYILNKSSKNQLHKKDPEIKCTIKLVLSEGHISDGAVSRWTLLNLSHQNVKLIPLNSYITKAHSFEYHIQGHFSRAQIA